MPHTLLLLKRQISAKLLALGVYLRSGYPILSARIIPLVMQLILGQPREDGRRPRAVGCLDWAAAEC